MKSRLPLIIAAATLISVVGLIALSLLLTPEKLKPAFDVAVRFTNAAGMQQNEVAMALLSDELQAYVSENCFAGQVFGCISGYTPPDWGYLLHENAAVYRRSIPEGEDLWHVQLIATYERGEGFAGVCIYNRVEEVAPDDWRITAWSGYVSCDEANSGIQGLRQPDAPNRVPPVSES